MKKYITKQSNIKGAGKGLFTNAFFKKGEVIGLAHVNGQPTKEVGSNHNHNEKNPTANNIKNGNKRYLIASKNLKPGEEITTNYRLQPELEQPEDFEKKKSKTMTPQKDGYRTYSPFKNLPYIDVESDTIDSNNIVYDLKLKANNGLTKFIKKNTGLHTLPGAKVIREIPVKRKGGALLTKKVTCKKCGWKWDAEDGGKDITTCHECGGQGLVHAQDGGHVVMMSGCPEGMVWSKKDKKCVNLPVFNNGLNSGTFTKSTNLNDALDIKPFDPYSDFGKEKPKKIPAIKDSFLETLEKDINDFLENPLKKAAQVSESLKEKGEDPSDALRHSTAGALTAQTIANKTGNIPFISNPLGYLGANIAGIGHELSTLSQAHLDDRPWSVKLQESLEDIYNNSAGANTIFNNKSEKDKINYLLKLTRENKLPDGYGEERPFRDNPKWTDPYNQKQYGGNTKTKLSDKEEKTFQKFYNTLPNNLQSDDDTYDIRGYWDSEGRPSEFNYNQPKEKDGYYHAYSINGNTGEYLKSPAHETFQHAIDEDRKIGYRPIPNIFGRNIATENLSIADPEEQSFLRNTEGPANYIEADLNEDEIEEYRRGGYIVEEINNFQNGGYVVEELPEMQSGGSPSEVWYQYTGTPWSEARKKGLTDGSKEKNIELRKRILAGEFGKPKFSNEKYQNVNSNYDKNVKKMVAQGKTLDQLVQQKVGTRAGLKSRFPELFKTKSKLDNFMPKNYNSSNYNSSSSKNKNTKSRWGNVTVESNDGKPSYRKDDYIDMVQSKDSKTKAEGLAMQAEHKKHETEKLKKQLEYLKDSGFDSKALLANAKNQRDKIIEKPKVKVEPIPGSMASQFKGDPYKKYYDDKGKEIKPITLPVEEGFKWDDNKGLLEQKWFPYSEKFIKSQKYKPEGFWKMYPDPSTKEAQAYLKAEQAKEDAKINKEDFQYREDMIKENPEVSIEEIDQFIQDQKDEEWLSRQPSAANNYNDGPIQMVYPEKYFIGPGKGIVGNLFKNPYVMGAGNLYFGAQGISEWADSNSDLRKSIGKAWDDPTWNNIGDFGYELGMNALNFVGLPFGKYYKNYKNIGKIPIRKYGPFKPRKPKTINLNQNPGWLQLPKVNSKGYFEYKKYQDGGNVSKTWEQKTDNYKLNKEIISDLSKEEINKLVSQGYIVEQIN